jgi:hypothetical protein
MGIIIPDITGTTTAMRGTTGAAIGIPIDTRTPIETEKVLTAAISKEMGS